MLLFIALANSPIFVFGGDPGVETAPNLVEGVFEFFMYMLVNAHAYPMFAFLFGYGLVQLANRQDAAGAPVGQVRAVLLRRNAWLIAFGFVHAALLLYGDFLGAYGILGIFATLVLLRRSDKVHRVVLWLFGLSILFTVFLAVQAVLGLIDNPGTDGLSVVPRESLSNPDYWSSIVDRIAEWVPHTLSVIMFIHGVWLGMWAARKRLLEEPERHVGLLWTIAGIGLGVATITAIPMAAVAAGWLHTSPETIAGLSLLHDSGGLPAGAGYAAVFGLLALWLRRCGRQPGVLARSFAALGQRSLSGYLTQSVAWILLLSPFVWDLGDRFGSPALTAAVVAVGVWLMTVIAAAVADRRNIRGPAEVLLRRLTYRV